MILLITSLANAPSCASSLQEAVNEGTVVAASSPEAVAKLQAQEFSAVVIDQLLLDSEPEESEAIFKNLGSAVPVYVNFALAGMERICRELKSALNRRAREVQVARTEAEQSLRHQLSEKMTALLMSCEMALQVPELPAAAENKLRSVDALARELRETLGVSG